MARASAGATAQAPSDGPARRAAPAGPAAPRFAAPVFALWFVTALLLAIFIWPDPTARLGDDPDSLLRLVQVRDFLAGQGLRDLVQHRLDPPAGLAMHWSRLIDVPVAALIAGLAPIAGGKAEALAMTAWPLLLFLGFVAAATWTSVALAGAAAAFPAAVLAALAVDPLIHFLPGRLDHHNAQLALLLVAVGAAANVWRGPRFGLAAGLACAAMLAIGLETLPYVAVMGATLALLWAFGRAPDRAAAAFGLAFAVGLPLLQSVSTPLVSAPVCDALSPAFVLPGAVAGLGLAALAELARPAGLRPRLAALGLLAALALGAMLLVNPACLAGPYAAASPDLAARWLDTVAEAQGLVAFALARPAEALGKSGAVILALGLGLRLLLRRDIEPARRDAALMLIALCATAFALMLYQIRAAAFANALALPLLAAFVAGIRERAVGSAKGEGITPGIGSGTRTSITLLGAWLAATQIAWYGLGYAGAAALPWAGVPADRAFLRRPAHDVPGGVAECVDLSSAALLASVPAGLVLAPVFYGPAVLALSGHSVLAGPYHRGGEAILFVIDAFAAPPAEARRQIAARGIDYVAFCATSEETAFAPQEAPEGLLALLASGRKIPWLEAVTGREAGSLRLYRVVPPA